MVDTAAGAAIDLFLEGAPAALSGGVVDTAASSLLAAHPILNYKQLLSVGSLFRREREGGTERSEEMCSFVVVVGVYSVLRSTTVLLASVSGLWIPILDLEIACRFRVIS